MENYKYVDPEFSGSTFGFDVQHREGKGRLVTMYVEDDGTWHGKLQFDEIYIKEIIRCLEEVKDSQ